MWRSKRGYVWFVMTTVALLGLLRVAVPRERGPRVEVVCPRAPEPVRIGGHTVLVYELHLTNFDRVALTVSELEVFGDAGGAAALEAVSGDGLAAMMARVGDAAAKEPRKIERGARAVVFVWIELKEGEAVPRRLGHRIVFTSGDEQKESDRVTATLKDFPVEVSRAVVPVLSSPFRDGVWVAGDGPGNDSPHRRALLAIDGGVHAPERFASDWVKVGANGDARKGKERNEDYWAFGEPILAVADGEIVAMMNGIEDNTPGRLPQPVTLDNILGNITLRVAGNRYVTYAHLEKGSVGVQLHQRVRRGAVMARIGNSGQATAPHLHLQVTDGISALQNEGVPFVFERFMDFGPGESYEADKHPSIPRERALPGKDEVVGLTAAKQK
jgi:murein DD-endopeptidase